MQDYHDLFIWKESFQFTITVYKLTQRFPREEIYGITTQLRRAAVSVTANICEGRGKHTKKDFSKYLYISKGSLNECECYIELATELGYIDSAEKEDFRKRIKIIASGVNNLILHLEG